MTTEEKELARSEAKKWIENCGDTEIRSMYGHHMRSFIAGYEYASKVSEAKDKRIVELGESVSSLSQQIEAKDKRIQELEKVQEYYNEAMLKSALKCESLSTELETAKARIKELEIHRDEKEVMIQAFSKICNLFNGYQWVKEGRGPYTYDDNGYRLEVTNLYNEFNEIRKDTWYNVNTKTAEYKRELLASAISTENDALKIKIEGRDQTLRLQSTELEEAKKLINEMGFVMVNMKSYLELCQSEWKEGDGEEVLFHEVSNIIRKCSKPLT